jgi:putative spermidine/putrescine transport system substrate-binding protein
MRNVTRWSLVLLLISFVGCGGGDVGEEDAPAAPETLVVASFGGAWQEAQSASMFQPFAAATGVTVEEREYAGELELVREHGEAGEWDVIDVEPAELLHGVEEGLFEPIDWSGIDRDALLPSAVHEYGVGLMTYAIVHGFSTEAHESAPATWADFWDTERFPGKRALRDNPQWMLEIALLADGVPAADLYPLDLDRAFAALDRLRDHVVMFDDWAEPAELLAAGEVTFAVGTNGRLAAARDAGEPVDFSWQGSVVSSDWFVIPKGSQNKARAQELVAYAVGLEAQSAFPRLIDYGPVRTDALEALPAEVQERLPSQPAHMADAVLFDAEWWRANEDEANRRWEEWTASL